MRGLCTETITSEGDAAPNVVYPGLNALAMVLFYLFHVGGCPLTDIVSLDCRWLVRFMFLFCDENVTNC